MKKERTEHEVILGFPEREVRFMATKWHLDHLGAGTLENKNTGEYVRVYPGHPLAYFYLNEAKDDSHE